MPSKRLHIVHVVSGLNLGGTKNLAVQMSQAFQRRYLISFFCTDPLHCLDRFVLCSFSKGTSMTLLEAMAVGVPSIVTVVDGNPKLISSSKNGWGVPDNDPESMENAMLRPAATKNSHERWPGQGGAAALQKFFSFSGMLNSYNILYAGELNRGPCYQQ